MFNKGCVSSGVPVIRRLDTDLWFTLSVNAYAVHTSRTFPKLYVLYTCAPADLDSLAQTAQQPAVMQLVRCL
jgi:hypothetical protein